MCVCVTDGEGKNSEREREIEREGKRPQVREVLKEKENHVRVKEELKAQKGGERASGA